MVNVVAVCTQKGSVGKTTCTVNLADAFVRRGLRVLVMDLDHNGRASKALSIHEFCDYQYTTCELMSDTDLKVVEACVRLSRIAGLDFVASSTRLARAVETDFFLRNTTMLSCRLKPLTGKYDVVLLDCPSDLGWMTRNALCAATHYLVPLKGTDVYCSDGMDDLGKTIEDARCDNRDLAPLGVFFNMFDGRRSVASAMAKAAEGRWGSVLLKHRLPDAQIFKESSERSRTVLELARDGSAAKAVVELADDILVRLLPSGVA